MQATLTKHMSWPAWCGKLSVALEALLRDDADQIAFEGAHQTLAQYETALAEYERWLSRDRWER